jgi:hypothetical protein
MGFPAMPLLFVVNLVAQHDPQANAQFARCRDPRFALPFLNMLATIALPPNQIVPFAFFMDTYLT